MRQVRRFLLCCFLFSSLLMLSWCFARMRVSAPGRLVLLSRLGRQVSRLLPSAKKKVCAPSLTFSVKMLSSSNYCIFSGILMFVLSTRMYLCQGDHSLRCSGLTCFLRRFASWKKKGRTLWVRTRERCFCFLLFLPFIGHVQIDSQDTFLFGMLAPHESSPLQDSKKTCLAHWAHVGSRHRRNMLS